MDTISTDKSILQNRFDEPAWFPMALKAILGLGVVLALIQYLYNRSLWLDEAMLANNLLNRGYLELLRPLDERQAAPILFLWIERFFVQLIPHTEYALRFFPFMMYIGSAVLFYRIVRQTLTQKYGQLLAVTLFAVNYRLVYYASEVKQYMGDVFCTLLLFTLTIAVVDKPSRNYLPLMISGIMVSFLSNTAPILFVSVGLYLILHANSREKRLQLVPLFAIWLAAFGIYYVFFVYGHPLKEFMQTFWRANFAFMPEIDNPARVYLFFKVKFVMIFRSMLELGSLGKLIFFPLFVIGILVFRTTENLNLNVLLISPMLIHLILSYFEQYPLELRLTIYFIPLVILTIAKGQELLLSKIGNLRIKTITAFTIPIAVLFGSAGTYATEFPNVPTNIKEIVAYVLLNSSKETKIYVLPHSAPEVRFYLQTEKFPKNRNWITSDHHFNELKKDIEIFRNYKDDFWVIYTNLDTLHYRGFEKSLKKSGAEVIDMYCIDRGCSLKLTYEK